MSKMIALIIVLAGFTSIAGTEFEYDCFNDDGVQGTVITNETNPLLVDQMCKEDFGESVKVDAIDVPRAGEEETLKPDFSKYEQKKKKRPNMLSVNCRWTAGGFCDERDLNFDSILFHAIDNLR